MEPAKRFEDLVVWQKSHAPTLRTYRVTTTYPKHEVYGLSAQMRRAAVSVSANIAEGFSRRGRADKARYMNTAQASLEELRYYFVLSRDLEYLKADVSWNDVDEVARILGGYIRTLRLPDTNQLLAPDS
jgi:four helix bundle protein